MISLEELIRKYLKEGRILQIATSAGDQPWCCTVYYASDEDLNLYWISKSDTRHSKEIQQNSKVAGAIPIKYDNLIVIGVQFEGRAVMIEDPQVIKDKVKLYADKFSRGEDWYQDFLKGSNVHKLYKIEPKSFVVFDRVNFPDNDRQEWKPSK